LEERELSLQELVAAEVAVVVGVGGRWGDVVLVDEIDDVLGGGDALGRVEAEFLAVLEHRSGGCQVVRPDGRKS
jgi:hypothetical protein